MAYAPGYYMPNYYNWSGTSYPYTNAQQMQMMPQQSYSQNPIQQPPGTPGIIWVDGEVGAKAYQMPAGMTGPIALWDMNDTVIYWKSMNPMGMPNPLQKIRYQMEEPPALPQGNGQTGAAQSHQDNNQGTLATKDDLASLKQEIKDMLRQSQMRGNQNESISVGGQNGENNVNRGGNR